MNEQSRLKRGNSERTQRPEAHAAAKEKRMNEFKVGDKVQIIAANDPQDNMGFIGKKTTVRGLASRQVIVTIPDGSAKMTDCYWFTPDQVRLVTVPALAPGVRVKTTQDSRPSFRRGQIGEVTTAVQVNGHQCWRVEFPDTADREYFTYEADELEELPDPEPQLAEVWRHNRTGGRYVVIEVGKQKEADEWHAAVMYRPQLERQMYSRRLESFLESFTRS
jgi:ribosomal protein L21E